MKTYRMPDDLDVWVKWSQAQRKLDALTDQINVLLAWLGLGLLFAGVLAMLHLA